MLIEHLPWKIVSLIAAVLLWFGLVGETELAISVPVSIQYRNVPPDLDISSGQLDRLFLKLRGPSTQLTPAALANTAVHLDLGAIHSAGEQTFTIDSSNLNLPTGVFLLRVVPSQIRVDLEKRITRQVPVEVRYSGPPPLGYRIIGQTVDPPRVTIVGPESRVEQTTAALTDPISLNSSVGEAKFNVPVYVTDPQVRLQQSVAANVHVRLEKIQ
jgi:YbbR domain-containing protein